MEYLYCCKYKSTDLETVEQNELEIKPDINRLKQDTNGQTVNKPEGECMGTRHILALLAFIGFFNVYCLRVNLSVAMVAMVNSSGTNGNNSTDDGSQCLPPGGVKNSTKTHHGEQYNWDENTQGIILGSFFYGYIVTQIPGGWLAEIFGGKKLFGFGVLCTAILTLLTPLAAKLGTGVFIALRVIEGLGEGVTFPAMHAILGKWAPIWERSQLAAISYSGAQIGTVISMPLSGLMSDSDFLGGWPSVFYVFGAIACIWFIVWMILVHDTPAEHPRISTEERTYIEKSVGVKQKLRTPWLAILTSPPVWAVCAGHFANNWGFYTMLTSLPTYMKNILKFDISQNGFLSAVPYLVIWVLQMVTGRTADFVRRRGILSTMVTRKVCQTLGLLLPAVLMSCIGLAGCNHTTVVVMLTFAVGLGGFGMGGYQVNHLDIAPNFAGSLMGLSNCLATIPGFIGPYIVGRLTNGNQTREQWQIAFYITAGVYLAGAIIYIILASGEEQPWNRPEPNEVTLKVSEGSIQKFRPIDTNVHQSSVSLGIDATSTTDLVKTKF